MRHTLSVLVENKPGVLTRVAGLFARRGFNIESLAVGQSEDPRLSRITITINGAERPIDQVTKQLHKLVNVIKIRHLSPADRRGVQSQDRRRRTAYGGLARGRVDAEARGAARAAQTAGRA